MSTLGTQTSGRLIHAAICPLYRLRHRRAVREEDYHRHQGTLNPTINRPHHVRPWRE